MIGVGINIFFRVTTFAIKVHIHELLAHKVEGFITWESSKLGTIRVYRCSSHHQSQCIL
jgi:hypothetical protein